MTGMRLATLLEDDRLYGKWRREAWLRHVGHVPGILEKVSWQLGITYTDFLFVCFCVFFFFLANANVV